MSLRSFLEQRLAKATVRQLTFEAGLLIGVALLLCIVLFWAMQIERPSAAATVIGSLALLPGCCWLVAAWIAGLRRMSRPLVADNEFRAK